jgi:hypothetical protein
LIQCVQGAYGYRSGIFGNIFNFLSENISEFHKPKFISTFMNNDIKSNDYIIWAGDLNFRIDKEGEQLKRYIENYKNDVHKIKFVDPNTEYDKFCDNNKLNDKRKALSMFIVNLMKKGVIEKSVVSEIILYLEDIVAKNVDIENMVYEIEEITENLFILVTESAVDFKGTGVWETIMSNITLFSKYKAKEHLSISSRAIFKYMDILDRIKNQRGLLV